MNRHGYILNNHDTNYNMKIMSLLLSLTALLAITGCGQLSETTGDDNTVLADHATQPTIDNPVVKPGIEVLKASGFEQLQGKRVGLITNPTGVDNNLRSTIDILAEAPGVKLTALFAPEHGVRGDHVAGASVANSIDKKTGVPVYSLHGRTRKPTPEMLKDVDVLVYDIQDIGCRSYTFISTMGLAMEAAARDGKEFMVLDRPNPLGGSKVEGNLVEKGRESFVGQYPIPYIYGLTPGELAEYLNEEELLGTGNKVKLTVVPMDGWKRDMTFADTGMPWVLPSPHIPTPDAALLYPATGIMGELNYVSIGVGYTLPFSLAAAPWIDAQNLADRMNNLDIPGVEFRPIYYKPFYGQNSGVNVAGVQIYVRDAGKAPVSLLQFYIMQELATMYPGHKAFATATQSRVKMFDQVCGSSKVRQLFTQRYRVSDMIEFWSSGAATFKDKSSKYYIYK